MRYVLSSAVITIPGKYSYHFIEIDEAITWLKKDYFKSTIAYPETAEALSTITGINILTNSDKVQMKIGDEALVFRLTKRISSNRKGKIPHDFIFHNSELGLLKKE